MDDAPVIDRIERLVDEEHRLWRASSEGAGLSRDEHERLRAVRSELDRCWDVLRRRRAGADERLTDFDVPEPPNELEGPEPEPPHQARGPEADQP
jgi:hypothetical protein